jgi:hypothetical protein
MGCCIHCRSSVTDKDTRRTVPEVTLSEITDAGEQHAVMHALTYYKCPSCKKEWSDGFTYEVFLKEGNALELCQKRMKACGYVREWKT